ncbi:MAG: YjgP/YjgQ family permease [Bacteroidetes bacterium]|nr:MAG: YjgP/YjgQ family permease [Bacteroidota bacterium]
MKLIDKYIIRRYLTTFFFILGIVLVICILVDVVEKMDDFLEKKPPLYDILFVYYANFIPYYGNLLAPICLFLAVIFFTSQMAQRSELIPLLSSGVSFYRILMPYIATSLLLGGIAFYLRAYRVPDATVKRLDFEYQYFYKRRVSSNKDVHKKVAPDTFVYVSYYNEKQKEGHNFSLERIKDGDIITKIHADRMVWIDSTQKWQLRRVRIRNIEGMKEELKYLPKLDTTFLLKPDDIFIVEQKAETMILPDLIEYIKLEEMRGSDILEQLYIERHLRFADPIAVIILTLIGYAMASRKRRGGIALQIGLGILICFIYIAMRFVGYAIAGEAVPPWLAAWMPNMIFFPVSIMLLRIVPK